MATTSLKSCASENPTTGLGLGFLYFEHMSQSTSKLLIMLNKDESSIPEFLISLMNLLLFKLLV